MTLSLMNQSYETKILHGNTRPMIADATQGELAITLCSIQEFAPNGVQKANTTGPKMIAKP